MPVAAAAGTQRPAPSGAGSRQNRLIFGFETATTRGGVFVPAIPLQSYETQIPRPLHSYESRATILGVAQAPKSLGFFWFIWHSYESQHSRCSCLSEQLPRAIIFMNH
jgi:hypothetical protein